MLSIKFDDELHAIQGEMGERNKKRNVLKDLDLFVLDTSIRETTVGQLRGHTLENKIKIYEETQLCGFQYNVVAAFNHMTRVDDAFCKWLADNNKDRSKMFAFAEVYDKVKKGRFDPNSLPVSLQKCKRFAIPNVILEIDLTHPNVDRSKFCIQEMCVMLQKRLNWCYDNLSSESKILINFRDFARAMKSADGIIRTLTIVKFMASSQNRGFGICFEESGEFLPNEIGVLCASIRRVMDSGKWHNGKLLVHGHKSWGTTTMNQLECLMNGADGIWAAVCEEGAYLGHVSSTVTLINLIRMGNKKVQNKYNCKYLRQAAVNVTKLTTGKSPYYRELIYGERALDQWLPGVKTDQTEFNLVEFFGEVAPMRITDVASPAMIKQHLINLFGENSQFTEAIGSKMLEQILADMCSGCKTEYQSDVGIALLFGKVGGKLTNQMRSAITKSDKSLVLTSAAKIENRHAKEISGFIPVPAC